MFVHFLAWDERYAGEFLKELLAAVFDITVYCQHVILVIPPRVTPADVFEREMTRILPENARDAAAPQFLYLIDRYRLRPKLRIRKVVEEDNDDMTEIIRGESAWPKELYGDYYVSEIIRYPDGRRQLIVGEDVDGYAQGVACLTSGIDVDTLNENFELTPYNGLRRPHESDDAAISVSGVITELLRSVFSREDTPRFDRSSEYNAASRATEEKIEDERICEVTSEKSVAGVVPRRLTYRGEANAFIVEIFAMREPTRPHWYHDFLEAAFDCFPGSEYCAILLPSSRPCHQYLQYFTRVPMRYNRDFPMSLYVAHRAALREEIGCRRARARDREAVEELLFAVPTRQEVLTDFDLATDPLQLDLDCFVFECNDTILGLAVLRAEKQMNRVRDHHHIEDYVSVRSIPRDGYGRLLHFVLTPIFYTHHSFFLCEIARLSELTVIFSCLRHQDESTSTSRSLVSCLDSMIPVNPRGPAEYEFPISPKTLDIFGNDEENDEENDNKDRVSLLITSPRLATIPRINIDTKIVIVGASDCGIAFAEYLALRSRQRYVHFTNLTLISPHGIPFDNKPSRAEARLLPFRGRFCSEYRRCVAARAWINTIYGTMASINRREKYVTVMNQGNLAYDYLILTCGLQYRQPTLRERTETQMEKYKENQKSPWNCLTINDDTEAFVCLRKIRCLTKNLKEEKKILFYGHNIDCYCALGGLIEFGVKPLWITLIEPSLSPDEAHDKAFFYDNEIDVTVTKAILRSGVRVLSEWNMIDWTLRSDDDGKLTVRSVTIEKRNETKILNCDVLFNFDKKTINSEAFSAFCRAGLVFDGLLVIDPQHRTNDPSIFAAGTVTKYSRKFRTDSWHHEHHDSVEIGEKLAKIFRAVIDADRRNEQISVLPPSSKEEAHPVLPVYRAPVVIACVLPGNYHYLQVRKPGEKPRRGITISDNSYGEVFATGSCTSEIGYFRIRLNTRNSVEAITCFGRKIFRVRDMIALYGKHESMLNELRFRFRNSRISDFYAYFREPWAAAILHDRFERLRAENRAILLSRSDAHGDSLVDNCVNALIKSEWKTISEEDRRNIESKYANSIYRQELEKNLVNFLIFWEDDLPMYCTPHKQRQMYMNIEESPLYFEQ